MDRVYTREKVGEIAGELKSLRSMLVNFISKEACIPDFRELSILQKMDLSDD